MDDRNLRWIMDECHEVRGRTERAQETAREQMAHFRRGEEQRRARDEQRAAPRPPARDG